MKMKLGLSAALLALIAAIALTGCNQQHTYRSAEGMVWNTVYHITYKGQAELEDSIRATLAQVGAAVNIFDSASNISRINRGETMQADTMLQTVVLMAKRVNKVSGGAFDPTLGPAIRAWGFGKGHEATADTARLDSLRQFVGFDKWNVAGGQVSKSDPRVELNLSGIAKGYGCDAVADMFLRNGVTDFMVEIGGEIRVGGMNPDGARWTIAIDKPIVSDSVIHEYLTTVSITGCGLATSGDYRNFHTDASGNRFGHTLDPQTLRPAHTDVLSASVIAPTCMEADGYATACMVMGAENAMRMAEKEKLAVLLVTHKGVLVSSTMKSYLNEEPKQ